MRVKIDHASRKSREIDYPETICLSLFEVDLVVLSFVEKYTVWYWREKGRVTWLKHSLNKRNRLRVVPSKLILAISFTPLMEPSVLPVTASEYDFFVDLALVGVLRVMNNQWAS